MSRNPLNPCPSLNKVDGVILTCDLERDHDGEHASEGETWTETSL